MTRSDHREPIKFVGMYFINEHGEDYRTGQIIAQIDDGYCENAAAIIPH